MLSFVCVAPFIDSTGLHNLEIYADNRNEGITVVLSGVNPSVRDTLIKAGFKEIIGKENICPHINAALKRAESLLK